VAGLIMLGVLGVLRLGPRKAVNTGPRQLDGAQALMRLYGVVEPRGGPVRLSAPVTRPVVKVYVREGDTLYDGQELVELERSAEAGQMRAARAQLDSARQAHGRGRMAEGEEREGRGQKLEARAPSAEVEGRGQEAEGGGRRSEGVAAEDSAELAAARARLARAVAEWARLTLDAPMPGVVYRLDVRVGETLAAGDDSKVVMGPAERQVLLYVGPLGRDLVAAGQTLELHACGSGARLGLARVSAAPGAGSLVAVAVPDSLELPFGQSVWATLAPVR
jgi:multidrug efflux pump subunit AcrA (membrane-fusion protein)